MRKPYLLNHKFTILLFLLLCSLTTTAQIKVTEVGIMAEPVSNNAVCEGFIDGIPYLYSFGGIDSSKTYSGIHLKSFRYNTLTDESIQIADLPDTLGKVACAASRIGNIIYIAGGYHVYKDGSERSSNKMHRYDIKRNIFLQDAADIPIATDDHVQVLWRDRLIYLITGWNNTENIPNVQIYNPYSDSWISATPIPDNHEYMSFGASGTIINDTIYYFGGATSERGFAIQNQLRIGVISPDNPTEIEWSISIPDNSINGYRMASTVVKDILHWIGGSFVTYNYNGIAYNGTGGVSTSNRDLSFNLINSTWAQDFASEIPMDLRGIANINDSLKFIAGGMILNQKVTNKVYKLEW